MYQRMLHVICTDDVADPTTACRSGLGDLEPWSSMEMETQYLVIDLLGCWQMACAPQERRGGLVWTHKGSECPDSSVNENRIHKELNRI
jgi:hypothetical protein